MSYPAWISTATECLGDPSGDVEGDLWQEVGLLESSQTELIQHVQKRLGLRSTAPRGAKGYVASYPTKPWVADVLGRYPGFKHGQGAAGASDRFWLAVNVNSGAATPRFLVTARPARFATPRLRPPDAHPGRLERTVPLPIQLQASPARSSADLLGASL